MGIKVAARPAPSTQGAGAQPVVAPARAEPPAPAIGNAPRDVDQRNDVLAVQLARCLDDRAEAEVDLPAVSTTPMLARGVGKNKRVVKNQQRRRKVRVTKKYMLGDYHSQSGLIKRPTSTGKPHSGAGMWRPKVHVRPRRSYKGQRGPQVLRQLSTALYFVLEGLGLRDTEVQTMYINGRLFVATNDPANLVGLHSLLNGSPFALLLAMADAGIVDFNDPVHKRHVGKLTKVVDAERDGSVVGAALRAAVEESVLTVDAMDPAAARLAATHASFKSRVIFVTKGAKHAHAEQHLLHLLLSAGPNPGRAQIYGKKRPCNVCHLTFAFFKQFLGGDVAYNPKAGGYWGEGTVDGFLDLVKRTNVDHEVAMQWLGERQKEAKSHISSAARGAEEEMDLGAATFSKRASGYGSESDSDDD